MAYNSSGVFSRVHDFTDDRDNGIRIQASRMDAEMDGIATGLSTAITKDGTQTTTAKIPFAVGLSVIDNQTILLGTNSDIAIQYDETTNDSLEISANVEGAALGIVLKSDQGDDNADQHKLSIADGGVLALGSKISGSFVSYLTHTPNATVASSTLAVAGNLTVGGDLTVTGDDITMTTNTAGHVLVGDGTNYNPVAISGDVTLASSGAITIASGSVETAMIAADAITSAKIADNAINSEHYTDGSIDTAHIANLQITTGLIAADAITAAKIADDVVNSEHYAAGSIDTEHIADSQVTVAKMADNSIDSDQYVDGSIDTDHISDNAVTLAKMAGIARGKFIIGDASGNPAVIGPGTNAQVLTSDGTDIAFAAVPGATALAADNLTIGDAAILLTTSSGNITIDAAANDSDIIFKGTDGSADTTYLTIDGSAAGAATFNDKIIATELDISGNIDVDGTTNLDVVDIDGAVDMATTLSVTGVVTANAGVVVDEMTLDGDTLTATDTFTIDAVGDITLDADGGDILLTDGGTNIGTISLGESNIQISSSVSDKDIKFTGNDGGSSIVALTLDMSDAGTAIFNHDIQLGDDGKLLLGASQDLRIHHDGSNSYIVDLGTGDLIVQTNGANFLVENTDGDDMIKAISDGAVEISHNNVKKFETTATGAKVSGGLVANSAIESSSGFSSDEFQVMAGTTANQDSKHGAVFFSKHADSNPLLVGQHDTAFKSFIVKGDGRIQIATQVTENNSLLTINNKTSHVGKNGLTFCTSSTGTAFSHLLFLNPNGNVGSVTTNGSATTYATSSDYRLKENVTTSWDATSRLKQLKPSRFNFIADKDTIVDGFLAHEVSSIVPEAITGEKDATQDLGTITDEEGNIVKELVLESSKKEGETWTKTKTENVYQGIDQSKIVPLLTKTILELEARITALENA